MGWTLVRDTLDDIDSGLQMPNIFHPKIVDAPNPGDKVTVIDFDAPGTRPMTAPDAAAGDLYCGRCGALLVTGMPRRNIRNSVIRCKLCRAFNDPSGMTAD
jgi:hypothetical protein